MKNVGIICEYNPFHGGHKYMFSELRARGAERIICLMSGNAVQRGELAVFHKYTRARVALDEGADAVLELPFPYSSSSAECFAQAGVDILARLGVDTVAFGSESGERDRLYAAADRILAYTPDREKFGKGTAAEFFAAVSMDGFSSNDILGAMYIRAAKVLGANVGFELVTRRGAAYRGESVGEEYPSAGEIRGKILRAEVLDYTERQLPAASRAEIRRASERGEGPVSTNALGDTMLAFWRLCDAAEVERCAECNGVARRLASAAKSSTDLEGMMKYVATKQYTDSRFRRAMLFGMLGVAPDDLRARAPYVTLLAANKKGREFLAESSGRGEIEVVTKPSKTPADSAQAIRQAKLSERLDALYTLAMPKKRDGGFFMKCAPYIID